MGKSLERAAFSGMPTVRVGRGDAGGLTATDPSDLAIEGSNLTATKARLLLMASMLKLGGLPPAARPGKPHRSREGRGHRRHRAISSDLRQSLNGVPHFLEGREGFEAPKDRKIW